MLRINKGVGFAGVFLASIFFVFVILGSTHISKAKRSCAPIIWFGRLSYSSISLFNQKEANLFINDEVVPAYRACIISSVKLINGHLGLELPYSLNKTLSKIGGDSFNYR